MTDDPVEFGKSLTPKEQEFASDLYDLLSKHRMLTTFFSHQHVIIAAIKKIREENNG